MPQTLTDKKKKKIWHRCFYRVPKYYGYQERIEELLNSKKDEIFSSTPEPSGAGKEELKTYENQIYEKAFRLVCSYAAQNIRTDLVDYEKLYVEMLRKLDDLKEAIINNKFKCLSTTVRDTDC